MKSFMFVYLLSSMWWGWSAAAALQGPSSRNEEIERATADGGQTNNMTVAFVPLISIIANLLPRFFNRYASMPSGTVQRARSFSTQHKEYMVCNNLGHVGMKWTDPLSSNRYYQCHHSKYCSKAGKKSCYMIRQHQCKLPQVFEVHKQQCILLASKP